MRLKGLGATLGLIIAASVAATPVMPEHLQLDKNSPAPTAATIKAPAAVSAVHSSASNNMDATFLAQLFSDLTSVGTASADNRLVDYTKELASYTKWLMLFTFALAAFAAWELFESRSTAKRQLRAYIGIDELTENNGNYIVFEKDGTITTLGFAQNYGQTPAHDIHVNLTFRDALIYRSISRFS